jgi:hypothetical protein
LKKIIQATLDHLEEEVDLLDLINNSDQFIEKNVNLLKYSDLYLYDHQKEIFTAIKNTRPKLILYIAPTGTGKTLTPLGLSESNRIIFVCAARHVGLALARSAISVNKRIAFAFGCSSAEDVRLHYFAAKEYTTHKRSGQIRKVDNSVGDKVEIIICDIRSYLPAMYYMLAFNEAQNIITYWDEPTITMDYKTHDLHKIIKKNWKENIIPNFVLSSATLPKMHELTQTISDFTSKFPTCTIENIVSHDCRKTIPLINNNGFIVMPHLLNEDYQDTLKIVETCEGNLTMLRYFDLKEASKFIMFLEKNNFVKSVGKVSRSFLSVNDIDMKSIKLHYLKALKNVLPESWNSVYNALKFEREKKIFPNNNVDIKGNKMIKTTSIGPGVTLGSTSMAGTSLTRMASQQMPLDNASSEVSGSCAIYVTTKDAFTLTDGPTIFLANDVQKIAKFCIQQANIPSSVMKDILDKIDFNNQINTKILDIETQLEFEEEKILKKLAGDSGTGSSKTKDKDKKSKTKIAGGLVNKISQDKDTNVSRLHEQLDLLKKMVKSATLNDRFIPNKLAHLKKWAENVNTKRAFTSDIDEETIISIMLLKDVDDSWKVLLLLGIGVFTEHKSIAYTEIMKKMADTQRLYLIIADSDYIYGTNYQFCHGYLSKDLALTQEKIIQAMGRIGRNNIQQEYSIRFRDDLQIKTLFTKFASEDKPEVINMNILFNCKNIQWNGTEYITIDEPLDINISYNDDDEDVDEFEEFEEN